MKQFRHRNSQIVLTQDFDGSPYMSVDGTFVVPAAVVEQDPTNYQNLGTLFITEDEVEVKDGDSWWYVTESSSPVCRRTNTLVYNGTNIKYPVKRFFHEKAAREYHKKLLVRIPYMFLAANAELLGLSKKSLKAIETHCIK